MMRWMVCVSTCLSVVSVASRSAHQPSRKFSAMILQSQSGQVVCGFRRKSSRQGGGNSRQSSLPVAFTLLVQLPACLCEGDQSRPLPQNQTTQTAKQTGLMSRSPEPGGPEQAAAGVHHLPQLRQGHILGVLQMKGG